MGDIPVVVVNSTKTAKELMEDPNLFNERAPAPVLNDYFKGRGLAGAHHPNGFWKDQRKFVSNIIRTLSGSGYKSFEVKLQEEINYLKKNIRQKADGRPFDILQSLQMTAANFIWVLTIGERFHHNDGFHQNVVKLLYDSLQSMKYVTASLIFPSMLRIPGNSVSKLFSYLDQLYVMLGQKIKDYRGIKPSGGQTSEDFVGLFMKEMDKYKDDPSKAPAYLNEDNLLFVLQDFFLAGVDTTSSTLYWLFLYLARNPSIQRKAFAHIQSVSGHRNSVALEDYGKLPFINALVMETLRVTAMVPIVARSNIHDFEFRGHKIPQGTWFLFNFYNMANDASTWHEPASFIPERFLDTEGNLAWNENFKPFGFGRRNCLGESMAKKEIFLLLANLLKEFEFSVEDESNLPTVEPNTGLMRVPQAYRVRVRDRSAKLTTNGHCKPSGLNVQSTLPLDIELWSSDVKLTCKN
ncbi:putative cytochrome P450 2C23-like [Apostichopus japonicus]|uniref:Putative cytochrome P450 2C23-like n=2 Tax=Stichopus japonicus TaxID=307972 RepID=A0A2G8LK51_STIJA|nr:putative cytochrome P450 2C23-like [Apostichopus japonicus]